MIKNGPKFLFIAICLSILLYGIHFVQKRIESDIPDQQIISPYTIDLNRAEINDLEQIPGIGQALAQAIVSYRNSYGEYVDTTELLDIQGMTEELYNKIKNYISLGGS